MAHIRRIGGQYKTRYCEERTVKSLTGFLICARVVAGTLENIYTKESTASNVSHASRRHERKMQYPRK